MSRACEALEEEVAGLRAQLDQEDGQVPDPGAQRARAAKLQELLGRVKGAQASLVQQRSWLVRSVAAVRRKRCMSGHCNFCGGFS